MSTIYKLLSLQARVKTSLLLLATSLAAAFSACHKNDQSGLDTLRTEMAGLKASYYQKGVAVMLNDTIYHFTPAFANIPVALTAPSSGIDTVIATVDTTLVASYNNLFSENNPTIPANAFTISNNGRFVIAAGARQSIDSLHVLLNNSSQLKDSTVYLIPVRLRDKNGVGLQPSVVIFKMLVTFQTLKTKIIGGTNSPAIVRKNWFISPSVRYNSDGTVTGPAVIKLAVGLTAAFPLTDIYVSAGAYNDTSNLYLFSKSYTPFPDNTFNLTQKRIRIPAGSLYGADSLELNLTYPSLKKYTSYLLAVKLYNDPEAPFSVPISQDSSMAFLSFFPF